MKIDVDQKTLDKLCEDRVKSLKREIISLKNKLDTRDNTIHKLKKEIELIRGSLVDTSKGEAKNIAKLSQVLVDELMRIGWVEKYEEDDYEN